MKCDRCREQLPVGDGIDHHGQILCLACYMQGAASNNASAKICCLELSGADSGQGVQMSTMSVDLHII
jgi:hypothetical protein